MSEKENLTSALTAFAEEMETKLHNKADLGYVGWDNPEWTVDQIKQQLILHVEKGDFIDVANFALFAWHRTQR